MSCWRAALLLGLCVALSGRAQPAWADSPVPDMAGEATLLMPRGRPAGSIILMPGADGRLGITADGEITRLRGNQLIRTRDAYAAAGFATMALDAAGDPARAVAVMGRIARPVVVVANSRGATRLHQALPGSPDGIVIASGMLAEFQDAVGSPGALPPTLIVHHRRDGCRVTAPGLVEPFVAWSAGRARVRWLDGGQDQGDPCQAAGHHGFAGLDGQVVSVVTGFVRGLRRR